MRGRDLRLVPLAGIVWLTALCGVFLPGTASIWAVVAGIAGGTLLIVARGLPRHAGTLALISLLLFCSTGTAMTVVFAHPARAEASALDGRVVEVVADITSSSSVGSDGRLWFDAQTIRAGPVGDTTPLSVPVRIGADPPPEGGYDLGAQISVVGDVLATGAGERAALVVFSSRTTIVHPAFGLFDIAAQVRRDFVARAVALPEPGAALLPGLAVGDTTAVSNELNDDMIESGLSHLTAVSGANCILVVGAVFWIVALCGGGRVLRAVLSLLALAAFVVLVTPEPSVIRAATMAGLAMLTVMLGRPRAGMSVLCLAVVVILVSDPWLAATPGFALSAAATAALILLARPLARGLERWMPSPLALSIAVPVSAQLACGPIIALFSEQQSLVSIVANMLAAPAAPLATVIGTLACLASPLAPLADLLVACAWLPSAWIAMTATTSVTVPFASVAVVPGIGSAAFVALVSIAIGVLLARGPTGQPVPSVWRAIAVCVLSLTAALTMAKGLLSGPLATATVPDDWSLAMCDVGQGDALLVRSEGQVALIDTGPEPDSLHTCLSGLGISRVDLLIITHFDIDHSGGAASLAGHVGTVVHGPTGEEGDERILQTLRDGGAHVHEASAGMRGTLGGASWRLLWPRAEESVFAPGNDTSAVLDIGGGGVPRSLFLGDLGETSQRMLAAAGQLEVSYDVVKVAHHGSADQYAELYEGVRPAVALFSAGAGNDYGHPRAETLALTAAVGARNLRTDTQGRVLLGLREDGLVIWTEKDVGAPG